MCDHRVFENLSEAETKLTSLDDQQEIIRQRYVEQFTAMEQIVAKQSTSEYNYDYESLEQGR